MPTPITKTELRKILKAFPWEKWNKELGPGLLQNYRDIVHISGEASATAAGGEWDDRNPFLSKFATRYVAERITQLDKTTQEDVANLTRNVLDGSDGMSVADLATKIGEMVRKKFDDYEQYRALRIARSEVAIAQNHGAVLGYVGAGVTQVDVMDGTDDDDCAEADGSVWDVDEALDDPIAHPNCTRAFAPIAPDEEGRRINREKFARKNWRLAGQRAALAVAGIEDREDPHGRGFDDVDADTSAE